MEPVRDAEIRLHDRIFDALRFTFNLDSYMETSVEGKSTFINAVTEDAELCYIRV